MNSYLFLILLSLGLFEHNVLAQEEHPNLLQNIAGRDVQTLDGLWQVIVDPLENGYYNHRYQPKENGYFKNRKMESPSDLIEYDFDSDLELMVPGDWNTQDEKLYYYEGTVWYKRSFDFKKKESLLTFVYFEALNYEAKVYLNGTFVGQHIGGFTPFQFEVTDLLKDGENFLVVKADNKRRRDGVPTVNTDWWNYGGITRSVHLVDVPAIHIEDYSIGLSSDRKHIEGWVAVSSKKAGQPVTISIPELKSNENSRTDQQGRAYFRFSARPELWEPENPKVYRVTVSAASDRIEDEIGFRTIEVRGSKILLNGEPVFLKGISIHEEAPLKTGRVTSAEECRILLNWAKELGCNFVRLAHYPHSEAMVREAEKMGLMVWSEIPVYWTILYENPETYQNAENQLAAMIHRDKNRAAVILWSIANETPVSQDRNSFLGRLAKKARALDESRLITAALDTHSGSSDERIIDDPLGDFVDVIGINNYCGWYSQDPVSCSGIRWQNSFDKPVIISEFGGGALQGYHGQADERWTEEYQEAVYENNIEMLRNIEFLAGTSPWILMDFRSPRRHLKKIQKDFNRKGLISEQGVPKKAFYTLQEYYNSLD